VQLIFTEMNIRTETSSLRSFAVGLLGAVAVTAGLMLVRQHRDAEAEGPSYVPAGETQPATISLERIRAKGY
jgi:hypothetical protein